MTKFAVFAAFALGIIGVCLSQEHTSAKNFRISISVSPFAELRFRNGTTFTDGKVTAKNPEEFDGNTATARPALNAIVEGAHSARH